VTLWRLLGGDSSWVIGPIAAKGALVVWLCVLNRAQSTMRWPWVRT